MQVEKIMAREVRVCKQDDTLNSAARLMWENDCGCVPVIAIDGDGTVIGMLTDRDISMAAYTQGKPLYEIPVTAAMARKVIACKPSDDLKLAEALMRDNQVRRLPVVNDRGSLVGIISVNDLAREAEREHGARKAVPEVSDAEVGHTLEGICQPHHHHNGGATA